MKLFCGKGNYVRMNGYRLQLMLSSRFQDRLVYYPFCQTRTGFHHRNKGDNIYEFIFGKTTEIEYGDSWDAVPASACDAITPPPIDYIHAVGMLITHEIAIECVQYSDFAVIDAVDTIIALGWEEKPIDGTIRLVFHFGDDLESVKEKLYSRDLELDMEITKKYVTANEKV